VSSAILNTRQWFPGTPKKGCLPPSIQVGRCSSENRVSPAGVPKKKTSWRVGVILDVKNRRTRPPRRRSQKIQLKMKALVNRACGPHLLGSSFSESFAASYLGTWSPRKLPCIRTRILARIQQSRRWERNESASIDRVSDLKDRKAPVEAISDGWRNSQVIFEPDLAYSVGGRTDGSNVGDILGTRNRCLGMVRELLTDARETS
jgi:hypothetical protein